MTHSLLLETEAVLDARNTLFSRAELVEKSAEELVLDDTFAEERLFSVGHFSLGYIREIGRVRGATVGAGMRGTLNFVPSALEPAYGSRTPTGLTVFLRIRPWHETLAPGATHMHH